MCISGVEDSCKSLVHYFCLTREPRKKNRHCKILSVVIVKVVHLLNGIIFYFTCSDNLISSHNIINRTFELYLS